MILVLIYLLVFFFLKIKFVYLLCLLKALNRKFEGFKKKILIKSRTFINW